MGLTLRNTARRISRLKDVCVFIPPDYEPEINFATPPGFLLLSDDDAVKADAQAIYQAEDRRGAEAAFRGFRSRWQNSYPAMVKRLERDLPELLSFYRFPKRLWRSLRTTNIIERCFVEVRRRTRPMVCFVNVESVGGIIFSIFNRFNEEWKDHILRVFTQAA